MKFIIEKNNFLKAINKVQSVVERRNTMPILSNVLLKAENNQLYITATDLDIFIENSTHSNTIEDGSITVQAGILQSIVNKMYEGAEISIGITDKTMTMESGRSKFNLSTIPATDYPDLPDDDNSTMQFEISAGELASLIEKVQFAISTEETRYYLNGIYVHTVDDKIRLVATDGHRLARADGQKPEGMDLPDGIIIPRKTVHELYKLLDNTDASCFVYLLPDNKIKFTINGTTLISKLVDATFPDYNRVIPKKNKETFTVNCKDFRNAVDRVSVMNMNSICTMGLKIENNLLQLSAHDTNTGHSSDEIEIQYNSSPLSINFNAKYLLDIAGHIKEENITIHLDESNPAIIEGSDNTNILYVLMPMRS